MKKASWTAAAAIAVWMAFPATARGAPGEWAWPLRGAVITQYVNDDARPYAGGMHRGIDIAAAVGTEVLAARGGEVTYAGALGSAGITVAIRSDGGEYLTSYLHLERATVERGARVATGEQVGTVGTTGRRSAEQPHLHFGVRLPDRDHHYVDPLTLLPPLGGGSSSPLPMPVAAPAPARAQPAPVPAKARMEAGRARPPVPQPARRPQGALAPRAPLLRPAPPLLAPAARPPLARSRGHGERQPAAVPAGPAAAPAREGTRSPGPIRSPAPVTPAAEGGFDWGKLVFLGGLALLLAAIAGPLKATRRERPQKAPNAESAQAVPPLELASQVQ